MKSKLITIGVILLLIGGLLLYGKMNKITPNDTLTEDANKIIQEQSAKNAEYTKTEDASLKKMEETRKNYDNYNEAANSYDITKCAIITDKELKAKCEDNVNIGLATKQGGNKANCDLIKDPAVKADCTDNYAYNEGVKNKSINTCNTIKDSKIKESCNRDIILVQIEDPSYTGSTDICNNLNGVNKDYCVKRLKKADDYENLKTALTTKDITKCNQIADITMKNNCTDSLNLQTAVTTKNASICNNIIDSQKKISCTTNLAKIDEAKKFQELVAGSDPAKCNTLKTPEYKSKCSDMINFKKAITSKSLESCKLVKDANLNKQCLAGIQTILNAQAANKPKK